MIHPRATMPSLSEADWQSWVIDLAHIHGWRVAHFRPARTEAGWRTAVSADGRGFPDLVLARSGTVLHVELKTDRGRLTGYQRAWLDEVHGEVWRPRNHGRVAGVLEHGPARYGFGNPTEGFTQ